MPSQPTKLRVGRGTRWIVVGAILTAALVIGAIGVTLLAPQPATPPTPKPTGDFGPKVVLTMPSSLRSIANNTTLQIQIFGAVPQSFQSHGLLFYNLSAANRGNNGVNDELLNVTLTAGNATRAFFLKPIFTSIAQGWASYLSADNGRNYPALTVEMEKTVQANRTVSVYQYYNNLPFDPHNLKLLTLNASQLAGPLGSVVFSGTGIVPAQYSTVQIVDLVLNLTALFPPAPVAQIPDSALGVSALSAPHQPLNTTACTTYSWGQLCVTCCFNSTVTSTFDALTTTTYAYGMLPLVGVHISSGASSGGSIVSFAASVVVQNATLNLTSAQPYVSGSGQVTTLMSTAPSFSHVATVTGDNSIAGYAVTPTGISRALGNNLSVSLNRSSAVAGIQGVEYEFQHFNQYTYRNSTETKRICNLYDNGQFHCGYAIVPGGTYNHKTYDGNFTSGGIVHVNSTAGIQVQAAWISIWTDGVIRALLEGHSNGSVTLSKSGTGTSLQAGTIWADTSGYNNAAAAFVQAQQSASNVINAFPTSISEGLAIVVALAAADGFSLDAGLPAVIAAAVALAAAVTQLLSAYLQQFSTISSISGSKSSSASGWWYGCTNVPVVGSGSNYPLSYYESASPVSVTLPGGTYAFFAPESYLNATSAS